MIIEKPIRTSGDRLLIGLGIVLAVFFIQAPFGMAQFKEVATPTEQPAWLYKEREIGIEGWTELLDASRNGDVAKVKALLASGAKVEETDQHGVTPLYAACIGGHLKVMEVLLDQDANVNAKVEGGRTPLTGATWKGYIDAMELLLNRGADATGQRDDGITAPMQAAIAGNEKAMRLLIAKGASLNTQDPKGTTALIFAAEEGRAKLVELLLQAGASTHLKMKNDGHGLAVQFEGFGALHAAANNGHAAVVEQLLNRGMPVDERGNRGITPLFLSSINGHTKVAELLLNHGANPNLGTWDAGESPLEMAAANGHVKLAQLLLEKGARVNSGTVPPLEIAANKGHVEMVRLLLDKGGEVTWAYIGQDVTRLLESGSAGREEAVRLLLSAAMREQICNAKRVKLFLGKGADPNWQDVWRINSFIEAAAVMQGGDDECADAMEILIAHGADINAKERDERLSAIELILLARDKEISPLGTGRLKSTPDEEVVKDILERTDKAVHYLVEAEKSRRGRAHISPGLAFITNANGCSLSTLDPLSGSVSLWTTLKTCPEEMFVSDHPGAIILRSRNKLEVFTNGNLSMTSKAISLPVHKKKGWKPVFKVAGQLADGRLAVGYRETLLRKELGPQSRWTLYAYTKGKWYTVEQRDCLTPSWCLQTSFSGRSSTKTLGYLEYGANLGEQDWLWHPYVRLNPFFLEEGEAEKDNADRFIKSPSARHRIDGYHYRKFTILGKEHTYYWYLSPGPTYQTGQRRYQTSNVYLERSGMSPTRLSGDFNTAALEGKYLLWSDARLQLLDISTELEPIQNLHMAMWTYWGNDTPVKP